MAISLGTNAVVVTRVHCINYMYTMWSTGWRLTVTIRHSYQLYRRQVDSKRIDTWRHTSCLPCKKWQENLPSVSVPLDLQYSKISSAHALETLIIVLKQSCHWMRHCYLTEENSLSRQISNKEESKHIAPDKSLYPDNIFPFFSLQRHLWKSIWSATASF